MSRKYKFSIAAGTALFSLAIVLGYAFRDKLLQSGTNYQQPPATNWFVAVPFLLLLVSIVVAGYMLDRKIGGL